MKLSVSLPDDDVTFVDEYSERTGLSTRSSVLHRAISLLRLAEMESAYAQAWDEWHASGDADVWDVTAADGLVDAAR
jgi:Arc/MetJ-type ribon-helix-helix transcriptional regulator